MGSTLLGQSEHRRSVVTIPNAAWSIVDTVCSLLGLSVAHHSNRRITKDGSIPSFEADRQQGEMMTEKAAIRAEIEAAEKEYAQALKQAGTSQGRALLTAILLLDSFDIHGSGWIYNREESIELQSNIAANLARRVVVRSTTDAPRIDVLAPTVVVVSIKQETYFEQPDPQKLAIEAGTLTMDPQAGQRAARRAVDEGVGPGETSAPNPYRTRTLRVWIRGELRWQIAMTQSTRISERARL